MSPDVSGAAVGKQIAAALAGGHVADYLEPCQAHLASGLPISPRPRAGQKTVSRTSSSATSTIIVPRVEGATAIVSPAGRIVGALIREGTSSSHP